MTKQIFFLLAIISLMLGACQQGGFNVNGEITDASNLSVYFDRVNPISNTTSVIAKTETNGRGKFNLHLEELPEQGVYRVRVGAKSIYLILEGTEEDIVVSGSLKDISNFQYSITGSPLSEEYTDKIKRYLTDQIKVQQLGVYVAEEANPMVGLVIAMQRFGGPTFTAIHQAVGSRLNVSYPNMGLTQDYKSYVAAMQREYAKSQAKQKVRIGEMAPEIALPDVNGKIRKLSDLRGQVVLLDFWASWCGPCRKENPNVVRVYDKYSPKGFTVFSVSLDGLDSRTRKRYSEDQIPNQMRIQKQRWTQAIKKDNLKWANHVSDLKKWESAAAATYGVSSIPRTFLIDRDGKIAAINPRRNLEQAVSQML